MPSTDIYTKIQSLIETTVTNLKGEFQPTYLYIKEHSVTGLKYFGKTCSDDPYSYLGSGTHWKRHYKTHGKEHIVTSWCKLFTNLRDCVTYALTFSYENDIVKSKGYANIIPENGLDGGGNLLISHKLESIQKMKNNQWDRKGEKNPMFNVKRPDLTNHNLLTKRWVTNGITDKLLEESYLQIYINDGWCIGRTCSMNKGTKHKTGTCPNCGIVCGLGGLKRYHLDNCKLKITISDL
jgi:hypothetical protein